MTNFYPSEKFTRAISSLVTSPASLHERLITVFNYDLIYVKSKDLPEHIQDRFDTLLKRVTSVNANDNEGSIKATIIKMTTDEAIEVANEILDMYHVIESSLPS